jgi:excisionase family DNA binding protein
MTATRRTSGDTWLTVQQVAVITELSVVTLYKHARQGKIPARKIGRNVRFSQHELDAWMAGSKRAGT